MTISKRIRSQLFVSTKGPVESASTSSRSHDDAAEADAERVLIRLPLTRPLAGGRKRASRAKPSAQRLRHGGLGWSDDEHERFLRGLEIFPSGPWKKVAAFVGTRTTRQVMTHAQKYRQKIARRQRGLQVAVRASEPRVQQRKEEKAKAVLKLEPVASVAPELPPMDATLSATLAASPSSTDQLLQVLHFQASAAPEQHRLLPEQVPMTEDEFKLIDELFAEPSWAMIHHLDGDDSAALSFAVQPVASADVYLAPWMPSTAEFECHL